jgi:hypothetical protein
MARIRNNLRTSSRWGGSGAEYDTGYQYNLPERKPLVFGPFKRIWPLGERNVPLDTLQSLKDGLIKDDVVYPIWFRSVTTVPNRTILAAEEFGLIPDLTKVEFFRAHDAGDVIKAAYDNGTISGVDASTIVSNGAPISTASWQKFVYFGNEAIAEIRRYSPVDHAFTTVAGSPNPRFLFFLDNNLISVHKSGNSWLVQWSVDGLPEDWTGVGSGFAPVPGAVGEIKGYGNLHDSVVLIGTRGAVEIIPTGSASPSFRIENVDVIRGTRYEAVVAVADLVYYIDYERKLVVYDGNRVTTVGGGVPFFGSTIADGEPMFSYSARLGLLFVSIPGNDQTYLLNITTQEWVSLLDGYFNFVSDSPLLNNDAGRVLCYKNAATSYDATVLELDPANYTQPQLETGRIDLGSTVLIDYVDVIRTTITSPVPIVRVLRQLDDGTIEISLFKGNDLEEMGTTVRYYVSSYANAIEIQFGYPVLEGPFLLSEFTLGGNFIINAENPSGYNRADSNLAENFSINDAALTWSATGYNAAGNMILEAANLLVDDVWLADTGVEYIEVMIQKERNEPSAIG